MRNVNVLKSVNWKFAWFRHRVVLGIIQGEYLGRDGGHMTFFKLIIVYSQVDSMTILNTD